MNCILWRHSHLFHRKVQSLFMRIIKLLLLALFLHGGGLHAQPIGQFDDHEDVGNPKLGGSAVYNKEDQTYLLSGAGRNIWTNLDQFQYVWKKIKGDFIIK